MRSPVPYIYHSHWDGIEAHRYVQCVQHEEYEWATYYCYQCLQSLRFFCARSSCHCSSKASFTVDSDKCKYCNRWVTDCGVRGDCVKYSKCFCALQCRSCGGKYCTETQACAAMTDRCWRCSMVVCSKCSVACDSRYIWPRTGHERVLCPECYDEAIIKCKNSKCPIECRLQYPENEALCSRNEGSEIAMRKCSFCQEFVCLKCSSERGEQKVWACSACGIWIGVCCDEHQAVNGVCCNCFVPYHEKSVEQLTEIMFDLYNHDMNITKKEIRTEIAKMFNMSERQLREDDKYVSAFDRLLTLL